MVCAANNKTIYILTIFSVYLLLQCLSVYGSETEQEMPALHHVLDVKIPGAMRLPKGMQADEKNKLVCGTCHGIEDIKNQSYDEVDKSSEEFLRGGPYRSISEVNDFCSNCHKVEDSERLNVHKQLKSDGRVDDRYCEYCHKKTPDLEHDTDWKKMKFQLGLNQLCTGCHLENPHFNVAEHRHKPDKKMREQIKKAQRNKNVLLPLDEKQHVTCITCHTPHEKDLLDPETPGGKQTADTEVEKGIEYISSPEWSLVVKNDKQERLHELKHKLYQAQKSGKLTTNEYLKQPIRYKKIDKEILLRLAAKNGDLCESCHSFKD